MSNKVNKNTRCKDKNRYDHTNGSVLVESQAEDLGCNVIKDDAQEAGLIGGEA